MTDRYHSIDIIKGIAMIMVILVHYGQCFDLDVGYALQYCRMGCPIFFVASGFGIMLLLYKRYNGELNSKNIFDFYYSRMKALVPGWYAGIFIVFAVNTLMVLAVGRTLDFGYNRGAVSILCNALFLHGLLPFCNNNVVLGGWYIGTAVILYLITPLILSTMKIFSNRRLFFLVSSIICLIFWVALLLVFKERFTNNDFYYYFFTIHYPEYLLGIMLFFDYKEGKLTEKKDANHLIVGVFILMVAVVLYFMLPHQVVQILSAWATALSTYFILQYMLIREKNNRDIYSKTLESFGRSSYYIFLMHGFFAYSLTKFLLEFSGKSGIHQLFIFYILMPIVMALSFLAGKTLQIFITRLQKIELKHLNKT